MCLKLSVPTEFDLGGQATARLGRIQQPSAGVPHRTQSKEIVMPSDKAASPVTITLKQMAAELA
jgi:hypothetical protein